MTNETRRDSPSEVTQKHNQTAATFPEEEQLALVTVPPPTLMPTISQNTFQAPMFPQLEKAVNTMTSMLQQQMMAMLGVVHPPQVSQAILPAQIPQAIAEPPRQVCQCFIE
jgi:hypothetical protein